MNIFFYRKYQIMVQTKIEEKLRYKEENPL